MIGRAHCDVNLTTACNMACVGCSHLAPVAKAETLTPLEVREDLARLKPFIRFTHLCAVGGEPTIHPRVGEMITVMREANISDEVVVITNGKRVPSADFWEAMNPTDGLPPTAIRLSVYPSGVKETRDLIKAQCDTRGIRYEELEFSEFYSQFKASPDDGAETFKNCVWKDDCYTVHRGRFFRCPQSVFFHKLFDSLKAGEDGLELAGLSEAKLEAFLKSETPLKACSVCSGGSSHAFKWEESRDRNHWIKKATI